MTVCTLDATVFFARQEAFMMFHVFKKNSAPHYWLVVDNKRRLDTFGTTSQHDV
jgi:hypothetical protein